MSDTSDTTANELPAPKKGDGPNAKAAHEFLTDLRTRIATQPLPYQHGVEARALASMAEIFALARTAIRSNPGCETFAARTTDVLNVLVRPLTAKGHRSLEEGRLNGRDGADEFRGELLKVQLGLRSFAKELHEMAYGSSHVDALTPPVMNEADLDELFAELKFGFISDPAAPICQAAEIAKDEAADVAARRKVHGIGTSAGSDAIGLALSGGGIRSASFALGVAQVLAERELLKEIDFLSTVSGGGYTGSFLTQRLGHNESHREVAAPYGPDPRLVSYVRQNARFLSSSNLKARWAMVCATLGGMVLNWAAPAFVIVLLALVGIHFGAVFVAKLPGLLGVFAIASVVSMVVYGAGMRCNSRVGAWTGGLFGVVLAITGLLGVSAVIDHVFSDWMHSWSWLWNTSGGAGLTKSSEGPASVSWLANAPKGIAIAVGLLATIAPAIIRYLPVLKNPAARTLVLKIAMLIAGVFVPIVGIMSFYYLMDVGQGHVTDMLLAAVALAIVSMGVVNINLTAPHRMYRDALARTFIYDKPTGNANVPIKDINPAGSAPYHIINVTLNVPATQHPALKDRGCDFFMFSKHWVGATAIGYSETAKWKANGTDVNLETAMAVSGAAVSAHMGLGAIPSLTALLTLLNVRLGFWIQNPNKKSLFSYPGFVCLLRETFGVAMTEKKEWLNLSDGGHIENTGIYELLRRRCKFIICVDGEGDPKITFPGLMTLIRHARIDFGITINPSLDEIRPDPATGYSKSHTQFCRIEYPGGGTGMLVYIKLSVTGNESELIRRYRTNNPEFPHQTTLDQFFDQEQFEAYRQLGTHAANGLFKCALMDGTKPKSVPEWFRQLARNLLEPVA